MSFLGGVNLGSPADRNRLAITRELELRRKLWVPPAQKTYVYRGGADFLLQHGKFYTGRHCPERWETLHGPQTHCFENALAAAEATNELTYCEGLYTTGQGVFMNHAWCVDDLGAVVELTLPTDPEVLKTARIRRTGLPFMPVEHWAYYGAFFTTQLAHAHMDALGLPMFDRSRGELTLEGTGLDLSDDHDFPILQVPYDPNRTDLP